MPGVTASPSPSPPPKQSLLTDAEMEYMRGEDPKSLQSQLMSSPFFWIGTIGSALACVFWFCFQQYLKKLLNPFK